MKRTIAACLTPVLLTVPLIITSPSLANNSAHPLIAQSNPNLRQTAQNITVKVVLDNKTNASGVIIGKAGNNYRVVTNAHVVARSQSYKIQTPDGKVYTAKLLEKGHSLSGNDLAILSFDSSVNYAVATLGNSGNLQVNEAVYSAGFPIDQSGFVLVNSKVTQVTEQPLKGGYQLGYSGNTYQGMSGGPLLNEAGQVIGIVGMGKGAALLEAYTYEDESRPTKDVINQWRQMSFAVPVAKLDQIGSSIAKAPQETAAPIAKNYSGIVKKVDDIAQQVTVRIDAPDGSNGSGTIVGKEGNTYYVLTACHVSTVSPSCLPKNLADNLVITTLDGEKHGVKSGKSEVTILNPDIDVAIIKFNSMKSYPLATIGKYTPKGNQWLFVTGFPAKDKNKQRLLTAGTVNEKEANDFVAKDQVSLSNGQELVYRNISYRGMSGGGVFDAEGRLVGVNTGSEDGVLEQTGEEFGLGYSLGVPITRILGIAEAAKFSTTSFLVVSTSAQEIGKTDTQQIKAQLFRFQVPNQQSTAAGWINYGNQLWRSEEYAEAVKTFDQAIRMLKEKGSEKEILARVYYAKGLALSSIGGILINSQKAKEKREEALNAFQQATSTLVNFPQAWRWQGSILEKLQRDSEALIAYQKAIEHNAKDFAAYMEIADILKALNRYPEALANYAKAINLKPSHVWAYFNRGDIYYQTGKADLALQDYSKAIQIDPQYALAYHNRGNLYRRLGKQDFSLADFNTAIQLDPELAEAYVGRALLYYGMGKADLALQDSNQAIKVNPHYAMAYMNRGNFYSQLGKTDLALQDYNQAIQVNSRYADAYMNRGLLYYQTDNKELALQDYNQAIQINPQFANAYFNRGVLFLYSEEGKQDLALQDFNTAIQLNPQFAIAYYNRGVLYKKLKKTDLAFQDFNTAIQLNPKYAKAYLSRGEIYLEQGKQDLGFQDFNTAIQINPQLVQVINNQGNSRKEPDKKSLNSQDNKQISQINNPQNAEEYNSRGVLYIKQGKIDLAFQDFNMAIQLNPKYAKAYSNRGGIYRMQGKKELALQDFNQAIQFDSRFDGAYMNRGVLYDQMGKKELALQDYNQAIQLNSRYTLAYYNRGLLYVQMQKKELAFQDFNQAIQLDPQFAKSYYYRGLLYIQMQKKELAFQDFNQAIQLNSRDVDSYYFRGILYQEMGKVDLAIQDYSQAIQLNPQYAQAYNNRGVLYKQIDKKDLAIQDYSQAIQLNPQYAQAYNNRGFLYGQMGKVSLAIQDLKLAAQLYQAQGNMKDYERIMKLLQKIDDKLSN